MKKFWYLGETLLSAERTLRCPRTPNGRPTQTRPQLWLSITSDINAKAAKANVDKLQEEYGFKLVRRAETGLWFIC